MCGTPQDSPGGDLYGLGTALFLSSRPFHEGNVVGNVRDRDPISLTGCYGSRKRSIDSRDPFGRGTGCFLRIVGFARMTTLVVVRKSKRSIEHDSLKSKR